jgi:hypothetical protein
MQKNSVFRPVASSGCRYELLIYTSMRSPLSRIVTLAVATVLVVGTAATASARPKKHSVVRHNAENQATSTTNCYGTPIIMQGMGCPKRVARGEEQEPTQRGDRPRRRVRGSGGPYIPALQPTPSLLSQPSVGVYIPPPVSNPSERINQLNQSFPFNAGLGNNPTNRDSFIRYNLTR